MALFPTFNVSDSSERWISHPLFHFGVHSNFSVPVTFNQPATTIEQQQFHDQQLEQLEEIEKKMEHLQAPPTSILSRPRNRNPVRKIKPLQQPQQQQPLLQSLPFEQQQRLPFHPLPVVQPSDFTAMNQSQITEETDKMADPDHQKIHPFHRNSIENTLILNGLQGPIATRNGNVSVVPLYTYSVLSNGTLARIPILWTAMSLAMGLEIRGEIIRGLPCIKRLNQLFCPTAGNRYPGDNIERFIDENKALIRRMYGEFQTPSSSGPATNRRSVKRESKLEDYWSVQDTEFFLDEDDPSSIAGGFVSTQFNRTKRQSSRNNPTTTPSNSNKSDACESTVEVVTPYWAANSAGKIRAIVNTQHFEQAVHQEVCSKPRTNRCSGDCSCEQKYKWHRLLAYDPDNDCKGIFMDWFLFPSCCVCRCLPLPLK